MWLSGDPLQCWSITLKTTECHISIWRKTFSFTWNHTYLVFNKFLSYSPPFPSCLRLWLLLNEKWEASSSSKASFYQGMAQQSCKDQRTVIFFWPCKVLGIFEFLKIGLFQGSYSCLKTEANCLFSKAIVLVKPP